MYFICRSQTSIPAIDITPFDPSYVPLTRSPHETCDFIWDRVLHYVFQIDLVDGVYTGGQEVLAQVKRTHILVLLEGQSFILFIEAHIGFSALSLPHVYGFLVFLKDKHLQKYTRNLLKKPSLGKHLHSLQFCASPWGLSDRPWIRQCVNHIFLNTPNLTTLRAAVPSAKRAYEEPMHSYLPISLRAFQDLAETSGTGMTSNLDVEILFEPNKILCPSILHQFRVLHSLRC
jgi:hypothetical protein